MRHLLRLCAPLLMICACSSSENRVPEGPDGGVPPSVRAGLRDQGVDITALFAQPTAAEITAMRASWDGRVSKAASPKIVTQFALSGEQVMIIISQESPVGIQYGAVLAPQGALKEGSSFPILLNLHGLGRELALHLPDPDQNGAPPTQIITVWPAFQGHKLWFRDNSWDSLGNPWDFCEGGTDDALQMLDAALQVIPGADKNRIVAFGGSRGGNVALLAALRDPQIRAAISMAGPTDYFDEDLIDHPNSYILYERWLAEPALADSGNILEARRRFLACSVVPFAESLPPVGLHHGMKDINLPVSQSQRLETKLKALQETQQPNRDDEFYYYPNSDHQFADVLEEVGTRVRSFSEKAWQNAATP